LRLEPLGDKFATINFLWVIYLQHSFAACC
jgi:hypothetical protein